MKTWADVQRFVNKHQLPYTLIRFNMSLEGRLVDTFTGKTVAGTVKEAAAHLGATL